MSRTASTTPSAARRPTSRSIPSWLRGWALRRTEVSQDATSILDGIPIAAPLIANGRQYTIRVRLADDHRASLDAIRTRCSTAPRVTRLRSARWRNVEHLPPQNEIRRENLQRLIVVTGDLEGTDLGTAMAKVQADGGGPASAAVGAR